MKKKVLKLVTKLYQTLDQGKIEGTMQRDMVTTCITESKNRFSQTRDTPPMHDRLVEVIEFNVEKERGQQILEGTFEIPEPTPRFMVIVINRLRIPQVVKRKGRLSNDIKTTEHIQDWEKQKRTNGFGPREIDLQSI